MLGNIWIALAAYVMVIATGIHVHPVAKAEAPKEPSGKRKVIADHGRYSERQYIVRYYDEEMHVACYVIESGYHQFRMQCLNL